MKRYKIRLSYEGSAFCGWQIQNNAPSVQQELEKALSTILRVSVHVTGAGRTDTGVNAVNYIAHFDLDEGEIPQAGHLSYKLNAILPKEICIHEIIEVPGEFHARFGAKSRRYHYFIHFNKDPFINCFSWRCRTPLDLEAMNKAARYLIGTHDFSCFEKTGGNNATSICEVTHAQWQTYTPTHVSITGFPCKEGDYIVFSIEANRFLRNMVRAVVGSLVEVGQGKRDPQWIARLIESGTRSDAGTSVPGNALFFSGAEY